MTNLNTLFNTEYKSKLTIKSTNLIEQKRFRFRWKNLPSLRSNGKVLIGGGDIVREYNAYLIPQGVLYSYWRDNRAHTYTVTCSPKGILRCTCPFYKEQDIINPDTALCKHLLATRFVMKSVDKTKVLT